MDDSIIEELELILKVTTTVGDKVLSTLGNTITSKGAELALGCVLAELGYLSEEQKFQRYTEEQLKEINEKTSLLLSKIETFMNQFDVRLNELKLKLDLIEHNILREVDKTELGTRMTTINLYDSKIDYLYDQYTEIISMKNQEDRNFYLKKIIKEIEAANIPQMLYYINTELTGSSAGTQTPILNLVNQYLKKVLPFSYQSIPKVYHFFNYMKGIQVKGLLLFEEYCNYERRINNSKSYSVMSEDIYNKIQKNLTLQCSVLPNINDAILVLKYDNENKPEEYQLISNLNGIKLCFSTKMVSNDEYVFEEDVDCGPPYYYIEKYGVITYNEYKDFFKTREIYDTNLTNLEFVNKYTGANITESVWSCVSEHYLAKNLYNRVYAPCIEINSLNASNLNPVRINYTNYTVYAWK